MTEVFISFKNLDPCGNPTKDSRIASQLHSALEKAGVRAFFSNVEVQQSADARWGKQIDDALQEARVIIVVGTRLEHISSRWVEYEWRYFSEQIHCGMDKHMLTVLEGVLPHQLPPAFSQIQSYSPANTAEIIDKVLRILGRKSTQPEDIICPVCGMKMPAGTEVCPVCKRGMTAEKQKIYHEQKSSAPEVVCPVCRKHMPYSSDECPVCGYRFTENDRRNSGQG